MIWDDETGGSSSRSVVGPAVGAADGTLLGIRATLEPAILRVRFFSKPTTEATALADIGSDTGWSQLGADITGAASPPINSTSDPVTIGTLRPQDATYRLYNANIYAVVVKNDVNGTTVLSPDLGSEADGETNFTDGAGRSWTEKGHVAHRWRANGNANDSIGTNHGTLMNGATAAGTPGEGFFNPSTGKFECPTGDPADCVVAKGASTIDIAGTNLAEYRDGNGDVTVKVQGKSKRGYVENTDVLGLTYES